MKKEQMEILNQKKARLANYDNDISTRKNPNPTSGIYLTAAKLAQCIMVAENRREKEEVKKETAKKTAARKVCLQQKLSEAFQKFQDCMDNILSPSEIIMLIALVSLSANTLKDAFSHLGDNLGNLPNQRRLTVATEIIWRLNV